MIDPFVAQMLFFGLLNGAGAFYCFFMSPPDFFYLGALFFGWSFVLFAAALFDIKRQD